MLGLMHRFTVSVVFCLVFAAAPVWAAGEKADLARVEDQLQQQKKTEKDLDTQSREIADRLAGEQKKLQVLTEDIQEREQRLAGVQEQTRQATEEIKRIETELQGKRQSLARLVLALQRLSRMPPEVLLLRPSRPIDTARSFDLMQKILPQVSAQTAEIKLTLQQLALMRESLEEHRAELMEQRIGLLAQQKKLEKGIKTRQALLDKTVNQQRAAARRAAELAKRATDLKGLLARLAEQEKQWGLPKAGLGQRLQNMFSDKGGKLPVVGHIDTGFGAKLPGGGTSQGLTIAAAPAALVVAPREGVVRFAGPFRQYKLLIIIQHPDGEHSLLGGLQEAYARAGDNVGKGEVIGKLPGRLPGANFQGDSNATSSLYYERRHDGRPVDPRAG